MMREIREKLSLKYWQRPDVLMQDMDEIRKNYMSSEHENRVEDFSLEEVH
jgi:hypothetical protein